MTVLAAKVRVATDGERGAVGQLDKLLLRPAVLEVLLVSADLRPEPHEPVLRHHSGVSGPEGLADEVAA